MFSTTYTVVSYRFCDMPDPPYRGVLRFTRCRAGRIPFCFLLVGDDGYRLELQAESEDEMLK